MRSYFKMWIKAEGAERFACEAATSLGHWAEPEEQSAASCPLAVLDSWIPPPQHTGNQQWLGNPWALPRKRGGPKTVGQLVSLFLSTGNPHSSGSVIPSSWQFSLSSPRTVDKALSSSQDTNPLSVILKAESFWSTNLKRKKERLHFNSQFSCPFCDSFMIQVEWKLL